MFAWFMLCLLVLTPTKDQIKKEYSQSLASGQLITVDIKAGGDVELIGWDKEVASLTVIISDNTTELPIIEFEKNNSGVILKSYFKNQKRKNENKTTYKLYVPKKSNIDLNSIGGKLFMSEINGIIKGKTLGGSLDFSNLEGTIDFETMGGNIFVEKSKLNGNVHTMGGNVNILSNDGNLNATTMGGNITYPNNNKKSNSNVTDVIKKTSMGGNISISDAPYGAKITTMGGDIRINKAEVFVDVSTMGGDIYVDDFSGKANISTMGGDIILKITKEDLNDNSVSLTTMGGDVTLYVPEGFSAIYIVKVYLGDDPEKITKKGKTGKITSDFKLDETIEESWNVWPFSKQFKKIASGSANGGKNIVYLKTMGGNITIKEIR